MKDLVSGSPEFVQRWCQIIDEMEEQKRQWISMLRSQGFKAAHPNDGWVDRRNNTIHLAYPQFDDGAKVGDAIMIGWPSDTQKKLRPVRLIGETETFLHRFVFEDTEKEAK